MQSNWGLRMSYIVSHQHQCLWLHFQQEHLIASKENENNVTETVKHWLRKLATAFINNKHTAKII